MMRIAPLLMATAIALSTLAQGAVARADDTLDPDYIYGAARKAWAFTSYARYAGYDVAVSYTNEGSIVHRRYDTLQDLRRDIVFAHTFSREETVNPSRPPSGLNFGILGMTLNKEQASDPIGPLALAATYDFGLSLSPQQTQIAQMGSDITNPSRIPIIGSTGTTARTYTVRLIDLLDNGKTYHLGLTPLRDPKRFRLREMWVTAGTYFTRKILISANFSRKPYTNVPWTVEFTQVDGGPFIAKETAQEPLDFGDAGMLENVTVTFENIKPTSSLPVYGTVGINGGPDEFLTEP